MSLVTGMPIVRPGGLISGLSGMKTLTVTPADAAAVSLGVGSSTADVEVFYSYDRDVELSGGAGVRIAANTLTPMTPGTSGSWSGKVIPADHPDLVTGQGLCVTVWMRVTPKRGGRGHGSNQTGLTAVKTVQVVAADDALLPLASKGSVVPVPPPQQVIDWQALQAASNTAVTKANTANSKSDTAVTTANDAKNLAVTATTSQDTATANNIGTGTQTPAALAAWSRARDYTLDTDYATLDDAYAATPSTGTLRITKAWTRTTTLTIDKPCTIEFRKAGSITNTTAGSHGITVTSSGVTLDRPKLTGGGATTAGTKAAIRAAGTVNNPIDSLTITRPTITGWDKYGIYLEQCTNFEITGIVMSTIAYAGIMILSGINGTIRKGLIQNITMPTGFSNAYGVATTRDESQTLAVAPNSQNIDVELVRVEGVTAWEGFDTHGGINISFSRCYAYNCNVGFALVASPLAGVMTYAPTMCSLDRCIAESSVSDGSRSNGFQVVGAFNGATLNQAATATLSRCRSIDHGNQGSSTSQAAGAFLLNGTAGTLLDMCTSIRGGFYGYQIQTQNDSLVLSNCVTEDTWTNSGTYTAAVVIRSTTNTVTCSNLKIRTGAKSASYVNTRGLEVDTGTGNTFVDAGGNEWSKAVTFPTTGAALVMKASFYGAAPTTKPAAIASPTSDTVGTKAAIDSIRAALTSLGITS